MAFSFTKSADTVFGNQRVIQGVLTADSAAGAVSVGLNSIAHVQVTPKSAPTNTSRALVAKANALEAGTALAGSLALTGVVSGDDYYVTIYGS